MRAALAVISALILCGCVYTNIKAPLDTDVSVTKLGSKIGTSEVQSVLWLIAWGDGSVHKAAENGRLSTINHLDIQYFNLLFGAYTSTTTIAYGD